MREEIPIEYLEIAAYTIPTDFPESDSTLKWEATRLVTVEATAGGITGFGYTYADAATARLIKDLLSPLVRNRDALAVTATWQEMVHAIRNLGRPGVCSMAISAVDNALWDLKARLLKMPLVTLLGAVREALPVYGSGGFTSYTDEQLRKQLAGWVEQGIPRVKMKVGREPQRDLERVRAAREAIGPTAALFVDANCAYDRKQALWFAEAFVEFDVRWLEEPLLPEDLEGLRWLRERVPARMEITDGEYGYDLPYFRRVLEADAVDVLMADATRCGGITGFLQVGALCEAFRIPLSSHCAPSLHIHPACAVGPVRHAEYFHDHVRIEQMLFVDPPKPKDGALYPDLSRPGMGLEFKHADAEKFRRKI